MGSKVSDGMKLIDRVSARLYANDLAVLRPLKEERWITYASLHPDDQRHPLAERFLDAIAEHIEILRRNDPEARADFELI